MTLAPATPIARQLHVPQAGILSRPPEHVVIAAFALQAERTPATTRTMFETLRGALQHELRSDLEHQTADTPKDAPSPETGELGFADGFDRQHLTVTLGLGTGAF